MRGDTGEYNCSQGVCERSTHARRVDKKVRKGPEKIQGDFVCQNQQSRGWVVMNLERQKAKGRSSGWLCRLLSLFTGKGQNKICSRQPLIVQ